MNRLFFILVFASLIFPSFVIAYPIDDAIYEGDIEAVKNLIGDGANINKKDGNGYAPLHYAAMWNQLEISKFLIAEGADVNVQDDDGMTPLIIAARLVIVPGGPREVNMELVKTLLNHNADVNLPYYKTQTPLHGATQSGKRELVELFLSKGAAINAKNRQGLTPIEVAVDEGYQDIVDLLKQHGATTSTIKSKKGVKGGMPRVLIREQRTGNPALDGMVLLNKLQEAASLGAPHIRKGFFLNLNCQFIAKKEFLLNFEISSDKKRWVKSPELFDFVVSFEMDVWEQSKQAFNNDPLIMGVDEIWKVYKVSNPGQIKAWEAYYPLRVDDGFNVSTKEAQNLLEKNVVPERGPILTEICAFIENQLKPTK